MICLLRSKSFLAFVLAFGIFLAAGIVRADPLDIRKIPPIPDIPLPGVHDFEAATVPVEDTPMGDESLAFRMRLPQGWVKSDDTSLGTMNLSRKIVGEVARYYGPAAIDARSMFSIMAVELESRITLRNWLVNYILTNGFTLEGIREVSPTRIDALYATVEGDTSYQIKAAIETNGSRVVLAMYKVPWQRWESEKAMQAQCIDSFTLTAPEQEFEQELDRFTFLDLVQFDYPMSWQLRSPEIRSMERMKTMILNVQGNNESGGWMEVKVIARSLGTTLADEVKTHMDSLAGMNLTAGDLVEKPTGFQFRKEIDFAAVEVYGLRQKGRDYDNYELWLGLLSSTDYYYIISMITPSRNDSFYNWAIDSEVFKIVAESIGPFEEESVKYLMKPDGKKADRKRRSSPGQAAAPQQDGDSDQWVVEPPPQKKQAKAGSKHSADDGF